MTLEQLRIFVAVAERLHVTQAAAALHMTQSAASAAIQALEASVGTKLFDRINRRIELTRAGQNFLPEARAVLQRAAQAEQTLAELEGLSRGHLSLWGSQTISGYWLPRYLARFRIEFPRIKIELTIGNTAQVAAAVSSGEADLGFVEGDVQDPLLVRVPVGWDQLVLVAAPDHPLSTQRHIHPADLLQTPWVLREKGSGTRAVLEEALREHGVDTAALNVSLELPSNEAVVAAVAAGAGATVTSHMVVEVAIAAGTLSAPSLAFPKRRFTALRHGDRYQMRAQIALMNLIKADGVGNA